MGKSSESNLTTSLRSSSPLCDKFPNSIQKHFLSLPTGSCLHILSDRSSMTIPWELCVLRDNELLCERFILSRSMSNPSTEANIDPDIGIALSDLAVTGDDVIHKAARLMLHVLFKSNPRVSLLLDPNVTEGSLIQLLSQNQLILYWGHGYTDFSTGRQSIVGSIDSQYLYLGSLELQNLWQSSVHSKLIYLDACTTGIIKNGSEWYGNLILDRQGAIIAPIGTPDYATSVALATEFMRSLFSRKGVHASTALYSAKQRLRGVQKQFYVYYGNPTIKFGSHTRGIKLLAGIGNSWLGQFCLSALWRLGPYIQRAIKH